MEIASSAVGTSQRVACKQRVTSSHLFTKTQFLTLT
jgi:hypothetical protein